MITAGMAYILCPTALKNAGVSCRKLWCRVWWGGIWLGGGLPPPPPPRLTVCGRLVEEELTALMVRYPSVWIEKYVIMPNHIHALICLQGDTAGASPRPTLMQVLGTLKSLTTRRWNGMIGQPGAKLWQSGYHDHIIRGDNDFLNHWTYIETNPARWTQDEYYQEERERQP